MKNRPLQLIDTHCHIHESAFADKFGKSQQALLDEAKAAGVTKLICVGTDSTSSREALDTAVNNENCFASIALHPHEAEPNSAAQLTDAISDLAHIAEARPTRLVAIGECGLDYYYHDATEVIDRQKRLFRQHIELALSLELPLIFHIRDAFDDFFAIIDAYEGVQGVVHSFSAGTKELQGCLDRGLYIGLNGIMTFTKDQNQLSAAKAVPLEKLVIETDAPFLTPVPFRGKVNTPKHVTYITKFLSELRGESQALLAEHTTKNANKLFQL